MKHVLITGGNDGLGRATAQKMLDAGFTVTILGRDQGRTKAAANDLGCNYVIADVTDYAQVEKAMQNMATPDIVINNAGIWTQGPLAEAGPEDMRSVLETNTLGVMYVTRAAVPVLKQRGGGRIITVISQAGLQARGERSVYYASKWALTGFTKCLQQELKPDKIAVTAFYPGAINTEFFKKSGIDKDVSKGLDPQSAAGMLTYICGLPGNIEIPEIGAQNLEYV